ncbi:MAG: hypothetical protein CMO81_05565 [Waddliaceae bacterium]|nr:hypothetical protein [Waddliaceae bacterium]
MDTAFSSFSLSNNYTLEKSPEKRLSRTISANNKLAYDFTKSLPRDVGRMHAYKRMLFTSILIRSVGYVSANLKCIGAKIDQTNIGAKYVYRLKESKNVYKRPAECFEHAHISFLWAAPLSFDNNMKFHLDGEVPVPGRETESISLVKLCNLTDLATKTLNRIDSLVEVDVRPRLCVWLDELIDNTQHTAIQQITKLANVYFTSLRCIENTISKDRSANICEHYGWKNVEYLLKNDYEVSELIQGEMEGIDQFCKEHFIHLRS